MNFKQKIKNIREKISSVLPEFLKDTEDDTPINSVSEYKERMARHKKKIWYRILTGGAAVGVLVVGVYFLAAKWSYREYSIVEESVQEDEHLPAMHSLENIF